MDRIRQLNVFYHERKVGTLALYKERLAAFEYDKEWIESGFPVSPFSLPLEKRVFLPKADPFGGLFGVFADSLPDGWGRLLVDRLMLKNHIDPVTVGNLNRLAIVVDSGMGALSCMMSRKHVINLLRPMILLTVILLTGSTLRRSTATG